MFARIFVAWSCLSASLLACSPQAVEASKSGEQAKPTPAPAPVIAKTDVVGEPPSKKPALRGKEVKLERAPEATRAAFWTAVQAGRKQTAGKDYAGAIASFDAALKQIPGHPRALSGRGYARLLAGELEHAEADLRKALAAPGTRKLESAIAFNLGLVAEKRGDVALARAQFSLANTMNPSKAAAAKLAGGGECPVRIEYGKPESALHATWKELWKYFADEGLVDPAAVPADEAAAQKIACTSMALTEDQVDSFDACARTPGGPWLVKHSFDFGGHMLSVIEPADGGQLRRTDLGLAGGGQCGCLSDATITGYNPAIVVWTLQEFAPMDMMEDANGQVVECEGDAPCFSACGEEIDASFGAYVFSSRTADPTSLHGPAVFRDRSQHPIADVKVEGDQIVVVGGGCDFRTPIVDPRG